MSIATNASAINPSYTRVSRTAPCPVCRHDSWCSVRSDGAVHCMRTQSSSPANNGGGCWHFPDPPTGRPAQHSYQSKASYPESSRPAHALPPGDLDRVYRLLLASCSLSSSDQRALIDAGIPARSLAHYGTLPADRTVVRRKLEHRFSEAVLQQVPGLGISNGGRAQVHAPAALLVGVSDADGLIIGMQARIATAEGRKTYVWLSSAAAGGPSSGSPAHVAPGDNPAIVWITEGVKKADVCADRTGCTTIGLPGHAHHAGGLAALDVLMHRGAIAVVLALDEDSDPATQELVAGSRQQLVIACLARGLAVRVARWPACQAKGIDDLHLAGKEPTITPISALLAPEDPGRREGGRRLTQIEEAARYRCIKRILWNSDREHKERSMTPAEKLALLLSYEMTDLYPGTIMAGGCIEPVDLNMGALGQRIGVSARTAGQAVAHLADNGLLIRQARHDGDTGYTTLAVAPARPLAYGEVLPPSPKRLADASRHRCKSCGSDRVQSRHTCLDCGCTWLDLPAPAANNRDRIAVDVRAEATEIDPVMTISWEIGPTAENDIGPLLQETHQGESRSIDLLSDSDIGPLLQETTLASASTLLDQALAAPGALSADPWRCGCGGRLGWTGSLAGRDMWCISCGARHSASDSSRRGVQLTLPAAPPIRGQGVALLRATNVKAQATP